MIGKITAEFNSKMKCGSFSITGLEKFAHVLGVLLRGNLFCQMEIEFDENKGNKDI